MSGINFGSNWAIGGSKNQRRIHRMFSLAFQLVRILKREMKSPSGVDSRADVLHQKEYATTQG
jgi:hypothetical protein